MIFHSLSFMKKLIAVLALVVSTSTVLLQAEQGPKPVPYMLDLMVVSDGFDGKFCWFHPRAGAIPGRTPTVVWTMQKWMFSQSDVFFPVQSQVSTDLGKTWTQPVEHTITLGRHLLPDGVEEGVCDFTPKWHAGSGKLLGTGHTTRLLDNKLVKNSPRASIWSVYDPQTGQWTPWAVLNMPEDPKFFNEGAGSTQRVDLENGDVLLPTYAKTKEEKAFFSTVMRCRFYGRELRYIEHGTELVLPEDRGLSEPSLAKWGGKFFLTLRADKGAYVAVSDDGLHYGPIRPWTFDDGSDLGSYNTQAHWVTHHDGLFLVYTRRGANNDNVARHRAPLFMAQIDPQKLVVIRATERELVPNKGAQLGNFAIVDVNEHETWVTTSEGMAPRVDPKYGANGRVYAARILWEKPNRDWNRH